MPCPAPATVTTFSRRFPPRATSDPTRQLRCSTCHQSKPAADFAEDPTRGSRRASRCGPCERGRHVAGIRRWAARFPELRRQRHEAARVKRIASDPEARRRRAARDALRHAVRRGDVLKPGECSSCRRPLAPGNLHGHHINYGDPLAVIWACGPCHRAMHAGTSSTAPLASIDLGTTGSSTTSGGAR